MKAFPLLFLAIALVGCASCAIFLGRHRVLASPAQSTISIPARSIKEKAAKKHHASREDALSLLRREGILQENTQVLTADWGKDTHEWLIILKHPKGIISHWFVDAAAKEYSGSTCIN